MKKILLAFARSICRFVMAILSQALWLVPFLGLCWYGKTALPNLLHAHFGIDQIQDRLLSLEKLAELMKQNTSLTNPTALLHYVSAQLAKISVALKLNTLETTSSLMETLGVWAINLVAALALIYAIIRVFKSYRAKSQVYALAHQLAKQIQPELFELRHELAELRAELQSLKQKPELIQTTSETDTPLLPHE